MAAYDGQETLEEFLERVDMKMYEDKAQKNSKRQQRIFSAVFLNGFADKKLVHHFLSTNDPEDVAFLKDKGGIRIEMRIINHVPNLKPDN